MVAGILGVVESALVPFGLLVGQKALQSRYSKKHGKGGKVYSPYDEFVAKRFTKKNHK
jgi:hypothetical protein